MAKATLLEIGGVELGRNDEHRPDLGTYGTNNRKYEPSPILQ